MADILQMREANTRQLVSRARKHTADGRRNSVRASQQQQRLLDVFVVAAQKGEMAALENLLAQDSRIAGTLPISALTTYQ
jgi:RNA polymerase sigma-70 factor (ECF subfamily)